MHFQWRHLVDNVPSQVRQTIDSIVTRIFGGGNSGGASLGPANANWQGSGMRSSSDGASLGPGIANCHNSITENSDRISSGSSAVNWPNNCMAGSSGGVTVGSTSVTRQKLGVGSILDSWLG